jgi:hypothetical protein
MGVHLIKLSVGTRSVEGLARWQRGARAKGPHGNPRHVTRMWPRRAEELLDGGSIYWVIRGVVMCRQPVLRLDEVMGADGVARCGIVLRPGLVPVVPVPRKAFQGWRYLAPGDAPSDAEGSEAGEAPLPPRMAAALAEIGVV